MGISKKKLWGIYKWFLRIIDPFPHIRYAKQRRFLFIHIPKNAGTSVLKALGIQFRHHSDCAVFEASDPALFRNCYKFCFVRNPYDRLVSVYTYLQGGGAGKVDKEFAELVKSYPDFESFVLNYLNEYNIHEHVLLKPQYLFIYGFNGDLKVDYIGRFENLEGDFGVVAEKIGVKKRLTKYNASKRKNYAEYYTDALYSKVSRLYKRDFELFGYEITNGE